MGMLAGISQRFGDRATFQGRLDAIDFLRQPKGLKTDFEGSYEYDADVIVIGAGPAGISAAYTLAKHGIDTILLEHAKHPGENSVLGGIFYTTVLERIDPDLESLLPIQRTINKRIFGFLGGDLKTHFAVDFSRNPYFANNVTVFRSEFDRAFAEKGVERYGKKLNLLCEASALKILVDSRGRSCGVKIKHKGEEKNLFAKVIINAEGPNNLLCQRLNIIRKFVPHNAIGLKNVYRFSTEKEVEGAMNISPIGEPFNLQGGCAIEVTGPGAIGPYGVGGGFLYSYKKHIGVGIIAPYDNIFAAVAKARATGGDLNIRPDSVLNRFFLKHDFVKSILRGAINFNDGEVEEVSKRVIPEGGFYGLNQPYQKNLMLCGDTFGTVNASIAHEGTSHACETGFLAARTLIRLIEENPGKPLQELGENLALYPELLWDEGVALRDIYFHDDFMKFIMGNPAYLTDLPGTLIPAMTAFFSFDGRAKMDIQKDMLDAVLRQIPIKERIFTPMAVLSLARKMRFLNYSDLFR